MVPPNWCIAEIWHRPVVAATGHMARAKAKLGRIAFGRILVDFITIIVESNFGTDRAPIIKSDNIQF